MSNHQDNRVLSRTGARELTGEEINNITAAGDGLITLASVLVTGPVSHPDDFLDT